MVELELELEYTSVSKADAFGIVGSTPPSAIIRECYMTKCLWSGKYRMVYFPTHPNSYKTGGYKGYVYEHIMVAEHFCGRLLVPNEVVHHLDGNPGNNRSCNLLVLDDSQHKKLHMWLRKVGVVSETVIDETPRCDICGLTLQSTNSKYCSLECFDVAGRNKKFDVSKEDLMSDIQSGATMVSIGKKYGVSDNAIRKRLKKLNAI